MSQVPTLLHRACVRAGVAALVFFSSFAGAAPPNATVVEYYRSEVDHYFMTASPHEQAILDAGLQRGWVRTGRTFLAWTDRTLAPDTAAPVCRFLGRPEAGLDSHFYSAFPSECDDVARRFPQAWQLESSSVFYVDAPDVATGACPEGADPVHRVYNARSDANHRYVTSLDLRDAMVAQGWVPEGSGPNAVALCAPRPFTSTADVAFVDPTSYSVQPGSSLAGADDVAAVTYHSITLDGTTHPYVATTGHLVARDPGTAQPQASFFYVAYTAQGQDPATRPITFFFNGGPGSATVWLHLGSFGPKRLATGGPNPDLPRPYPLVDNDESLLPFTDLVFVDAIGAGLSQAIAPFTNRSFWSVGQDAVAFRNFIIAYLERNGRMASPKFLFGESYGSVRAAVLANLLETAGIELAGVVLQASVLDYHANCGVLDDDRVSCAGYLPSYAAVGTHYGLVDRGGASTPAFLDVARDVTRTTYEPALAQWLASRNLPDETVIDVLVRHTGIEADQWRVDLNLDPQAFRSRLIPRTLLGRYDARVSAPIASPLAAGGDPSSTVVTPSFIAAIGTHLRDTLKYTYASPYVTLSDAIYFWDFSHDGRALPDTIPDLAAAMAQNPRLVVLSLNGYHDLATPFHQTERDLARLGPNPRVAIKSYDGGHMTYLDDASRRAQRDDLAAMYRRLLLPSAAASAFAKEVAQ